MNRDVFLSLLALDAYNRGYGQGILLNEGDSTAGQDEIGRRIGNATVIADDITQSAVAAGFYTIAYEWRNPCDGQLKTIISYRGTSYKAPRITCILAPIRYVRALLRHRL